MLKPEQASTKKKMNEIANINQMSIDMVALIAPLLALTVSIGIGLWVKDSMDAFIKGLTFRMATAFEEGSFVYIDGEPATIIKIGFFRTTFQINNGRGVTWRFVPNKRIEFLKIEKVVNQTKSDDH